MSKTIKTKDGSTKVVEDSYVLKSGEKFTKTKVKEVPEGIYDGTLRVVTEADVLADPRVVAAGAVVGQLYDFSNLPHVKDGALEAYVEEVNEKKVDEEARIEEGPATPEFTSEAERIELGVKNPDSEFKGATD